MIRRIVSSIAIAASLTTGLVAQPPSFTEVGRIPVAANLVDINGQIAYIAGGKTLRLYNISKPESPVALGSHTFPERIWGLRLVGSTLFVAADFYGLAVLDVSNPSTPVLRGAVKTPGQAKNVAVFGSRALVADHMSGLDVIDVSDAAKPTITGSFFLEGYARDVISAGSMAYAIDAPAGLYVFDLSKPGPVEPVSSQQSARAPLSIELSPSLAVLVGGGLLQIYDVTTPHAPTRVTTFRTPSGRPSRATIHGQFLYVADGREGLQVVDVSKPSAPVVVGSGFKTSEPARDVAVLDSYVFLAIGGGEEGGEVLILRRSPP